MNNESEAKPVMRIESRSHHLRRQISIGLVLFSLASMCASGGLIGASLVVSQYNRSLYHQLARSGFVMSIVTLATTIAASQIRPKIDE